MTSLGIFQIAFYFLILLVLTKPLGTFMARVFQGERTFLHPALREGQNELRVLNIRAGWSV